MNGIIAGIRKIEDRIAAYRRHQNDCSSPPVTNALESRLEELYFFIEVLEEIEKGARITREANITNDHPYDCNER